MRWRSGILPCHTWFWGDRELYLKHKEEEREQHPTEVNHKLMLMVQENRTLFFDEFFTDKKRSDGGYTKDEIYSREECFEWINNPDNLVDFKYSKYDTVKEEEKNKLLILKRLNKFWDKYPEGVISFGGL